MPIIPTLTPSDLEKTLECVPANPTVNISIERRGRSVNHSGLQQQIQEDYPALSGMEYFPDPETITYKFERMEKLILLQLYQQFYERCQQLEGRRPGYDHEKLDLQIDSIEWSIAKDDFRDYKIPCKDGVDIKICPDSGAIEVFYYDEEPPFIAKMREALAGSDSKAELKITVKYHHDH